MTNFLEHYPTFEARDQEFRDIAARGVGGEPSTPKAVKTESSANVMSRESMTSPLGGGIKRKQPSEPKIENGGWMDDENDGTDEQFNDEDDSSREANRQAKKMKRVVKISGEQKLLYLTI